MGCWWSRQGTYTSQWDPHPCPGCAMASESYYACWHLNWNFTELKPLPSGNTHAELTSAHSLQLPMSTLRLESSDNGSRNHDEIMIWCKTWAGFSSGVMSQRGAFTSFSVNTQRYNCSVSKTATSLVTQQLRLSIVNAAWIGIWRFCKTSWQTTTGSVFLYLDLNLLRCFNTHT